MGEVGWLFSIAWTYYQALGVLSICRSFCSWGCQLCLASRGPGCRREVTEGSSSSRCCALPFTSQCPAWASWFPLGSCSLFSGAAAGRAGLGTAELTGSSKDNKQPQPGSFLLCIWSCLAFPDQLLRVSVASSQGAANCSALLVAAGMAKIVVFQAVSHLFEFRFSLCLIEGIFVVCKKIWKVISRFPSCF